MEDEQNEPDAGADETPAPAARSKAKRAGGKTPRSNGERALAQVRTAKKSQREVTDPFERARLLLAEANVLALLELADAIGSASGEDTGADGG